MPSNPSNPVCRPNKAAYPHRPTNRLRTRANPPVDSCANDAGSWQWRTQSPIYRKRVKGAIQMVRRYRQALRGTPNLQRDERDSIHRLLDTATFDASRRMAD